MNPEELKIGDLVRVVKDDYIIQKGTICKVIGVNAIDLSEFGGHKPVVSLSTVNKEEEIRSMSCENIEGIPLTKDILLKNGWKKKVMSRGVKNSHMVYTKPDIEEYGYFPIYIEKGIGKEFDVYPFTCNNVCTQIAYIKYVHQLQHLLFGLGLDSSMIV